MIRLSAILVALLLAFWAQQFLTGPQPPAPGDALLVFLLAAILFIAGAGRPRPLRPTGAQQRLAWNRRGRWLALAGMVAGAGSLALLWRDLHSLPGLLLWPVAALLFLAGTWLEDNAPSAARAAGNSSLGSSEALNGGSDDGLADASADASAGPTRPASAAWWRRHWDILLLVFLLAGAASIRFYQLDIYPNGCQSDECNNGIDALRWLGGAPYIAYAETNDGQATFFTYLIALSFRLFGAGVPQMRLVSAVIGVLTVAAFYFLARDLYGKYAALFATALLAAGRWHLTFSRIVYELIMQPLFMLLLFFFLLRALRGGRRRDWALAGLMLTGGMNTYTAFRVVPFVVAAFLLFWIVRALFHLWWGRRRSGEAPAAAWPALRHDLEGMAIMVGSTLLSILPLGVYIVQNWAIFTHRIVKIGVMDEVARAGSWEPVRANFFKTLFMYNWLGDGGSLNNLPGAPMFDTLVALLFVLGLGYSLYYALQGRALPVLYLLWFWAILSLGVFSAAHEAPSARRTIGMIPLAYLLAALVADQVWRQWHAALRGAGSRLLAAGTAALVVAVAFANIHTYFVVQAPDPQVWGAYSPIESSIGRYLETLPPDATVLIAPRFEHHAAIRLYAQDRTFRAWDAVADVPFNGPWAADVASAAATVSAASAANAGDGGLVYILETTNEPLLRLLQTIYPTGVAQEHHDRYGLPLFLSFAVGVEEAQAIHGLAGSYFESPLAAPALLAASGFQSPLAAPPFAVPAASTADSTAASTAGAPAATTAALTAAITDTVEALDLDLAAAPVTPPFSARWQGTLLAQEFGEYTFTLRSAGRSAALQVGQQPLLAVAESGENVMTVTLPAGFHPVALAYEAGPPAHNAADTETGAEAGAVQVHWSGPHFTERILGPDALYQFDLGRQGLMGYYYPNAQWEGAPVRVSIDVYISASNAVPVPYSVRWLGKIIIPVTGEYIFGTKSDDGSFVYIDGQLVVDNGGEHGTQDRQGVLRLEAGLHDLELRYFENGGSQEMQFWWQPPNRPQAVVDMRYLVPLTGGELPAEYAALLAAAAALAKAQAAMEAVTQTEAQTGAGAPIAAEAATGHAANLPGDIAVFAGGFNGPRGIAVDAAGQVYVAEGGGDKVLVLDANGRRLGELPRGADVFDHPVDVVTGDRGVYVLDESGRLGYWTPEGDLLAEFSDPGLPLGRSRGIGNDAQGRLWVANTSNGRVLAFAPDGSPLPDQPIWTGAGAQPSDVQGAADGSIFVADPVQASLTQYAPDGEPQRAWIIAAANTLDSPHLALDAFGNLYLTDPEGGRVLQFSAAGDLQGAWDLAAQLERPVKPVGIAAGPDGRIWVTDVTNGDVIVIDPARR